MAGKATTGAEQASAGLFENRAYILTPGDLATPAARWLLGVIEAIGSNVVLMSPEDLNIGGALDAYIAQLTALRNDLPRRGGSIRGGGGVSAQA